MHNNRSACLSRGGGRGELAMNRTGSSGDSQAPRATYSSQIAHTRAFCAGTPFKTDKTRVSALWLEKREQVSSLVGDGLQLAEVDKLLGAYNFNVETAADAFFAGSWTPPRPAPEEHPEHIDSRSSPPAPVQMDRTEQHSGTTREQPGASKRARSETFNTSGQPSSSMGADAPPFTTASLGSASTTMDVVTAAFLALMNPIREQLEALEQKLPNAVAQAVPTAVRAYDEEVAVRSQQKVIESNLGATLAAINESTTMSALGKIEGFRFNPHENSLTCINCEAYAHFSGCQNAKGAGRIQGPDLSRSDGRKDSMSGVGRIRRPLQIVKESVKQHLCGEVHIWCDVHAAERKQRDREKDDAAILCGRHVYSLHPLQYGCCS